MTDSIDLFLMTLLGFSGSFGHCAGMCGPLVAAFSLSREGGENKYGRLGFHALLNLGRSLSYAIVGAALGVLGSASIATGELAGIGSGGRQIMVVLTGMLLVWMGLGLAVFPLTGSLNSPYCTRCWEDGTIASIGG